MGIHIPMLLLSILSFTTLVHSQRCNQNSLNSLLQEYITPSAAERALEILKLAAGQKSVPGACKDYSPYGYELVEEIIGPCPPAYQSQALPIGPLLQKQAIPRRPSQQPTYGLPVQAPVPTQRPVPAPQQLVQKVPARQPAPYPVQYARPPGPCPLQSLVNPLLPAQSPISAMVPPTSNYLPPVLPGQGRSYHLRKIPIPPPTL